MWAMWGWLTKERFLTNRVAGQLCFSPCIQTGQRTSHPTDVLSLMECSHPTLPVDVVSIFPDSSYSCEENWELGAVCYWVVFPFKCQRTLTMKPGEHAPNCFVTDCDSTLNGSSRRRETHCTFTLLRRKIGDCLSNYLMEKVSETECAIILCGFPRSSRCANLFQLSWSTTESRSQEWLRQRSEDRWQCSHFNVDSWYPALNRGARTNLAKSQSLECADNPWTPQNLILICSWVSPFSSEADIVWCTPCHSISLMCICSPPICKSQDTIKQMQGRLCGHIHMRTWEVANGLAPPWQPDMGGGMQAETQSTRHARRNPLEIPNGTHADCGTQSTGSCHGPREEPCDASPDWGREYRQISPSGPTPWPSPAGRGPEIWYPPSSQTPFSRTAKASGPRG